MRFCSRGGARDRTSIEKCKNGSCSAEPRAPRGLLRLGKEPRWALGCSVLERRRGSSGGLLALSLTVDNINNGGITLQYLSISGGARAPILHCLSHTVNDSKHT